MNKEEKEAVIDEYTKYWTLVQEIRDAVLVAVNDLPLTDIISVLDRVKTELVQQGAMIALEEEMQSEEAETGGDKPIDQSVPERSADAKVEALLENIENMGEISKEVKGRINS